jgi:hypothetical protein
MRLPGSHIGPITPEQRQALRQTSLVAGVYEQAVDRESAYEKLKGAPAEAAHSPRASTSTPRETGSPQTGGLGDWLFGSTGPRGAQRDGLAQILAKSAMRAIGSQVGRDIVRGVLGSILGGGGRRR